MTEASRAEPFFITQTGERMTPDELDRWRDERCAEARAEGAQWLRISMNQGFSPPLHLVEGWHKRPEDEGPIRWQLEGVPTKGVRA